ncbi:hypothetical protein [Levilactobacillus yiduensis]|uniref:hypothetical protein n=1 Tax=Levilactobacillus yiduensis TaxID=2953880 RepID=UPI000EF3311B|nr:hypothetical protein [Levilactobacillus yiduensis]AYM03668.1 hypothetical protein D8911_11995 [Levilactobacillus brevis]
MRIVYPQLVEDAYKVAAQAGTIKPDKVNDVKAQIYRIMVQKGMLNEDGSPTQKAIDTGIANGLNEDSQDDCDPDTVAELKQLYPMYEGFNDKHFLKTNEGWVVDGQVIRSVANQVLHDPDSTAKQRQAAYAMLQQVEKYPK